MTFKKCFTLLELILVIVIISIVVGLSLPRFKNQLDKFHIENFARRLYLFLDHAKTYSVFYSKNTKVDMEPDRKEINIKKKEGQDYEVIETRYSRLTLPHNISIKTDDMPVVFYPDGTCSEFLWNIVYRGQDLYMIKSLGFNGKLEIEKYKNR